MQKLNSENVWFAWIPILNIYETFVAGDEENACLWAVLFFIPYIEIVAYIMLIIAWVKICRKLDKSPWLTLLFLIPFVHWWAIGYLAIG